MFELFDPREEFNVSDGMSLPHWTQLGSACFITFRTCDSIPAKIVKQWHRDKLRWLAEHGISDVIREAKEFHSLPITVQKEYHQKFSQAYLDYLDQGLGSCPFKNPGLAQILADVLLYFDGQKYEMHSFVIMPNHVHLLLSLNEDNTVRQLTYSWKKNSALKINQQLNRKGRFWQEESFDHLVRSAEQFEAIVNYIEQNPNQAGLSEKEYFYYKKPNE